MSDISKRLRYLARDTEAYESQSMTEAADRIEALEAAALEAEGKFESERHRAQNLEAEVARMREALEEISCQSQTTHLLWWQRRARTTLKGEGE